MSRKQTCDFWIGNFCNRDAYHDFFAEDPAYYQDEDDSDDRYISRFAKSQGEKWIDHDFMERGFEDGKDPVAEKFIKYSYADQWLPALSLKN